MNCVKSVKLFFSRILLMPGEVEMAIKGPVEACKNEIPSICELNEISICVLVAVVQTGFLCLTDIHRCPSLMASI